MASDVLNISTRRLRYLSRVVALSFVQDTRCPHCGSLSTKTIGRKWALLQARCCQDCALKFRWPKDSTAFNRSFYQERYKESTVTDVDGEDRGNINRDLSGKVDLFRILEPKARTVLDFGCSWGYITDLIRSSGYKVVGFETSKGRAGFGRKHFSLDILDSYEGLAALPQESFDAIFTSHVLEHLPCLDVTFKEFRRLLRPAGALLIFVPNCGDGRGSLRKNWRAMIGEKHTMAFDSIFFREALPRYGFSVKAATGRGNYQCIATYLKSPGQAALDLDGEELVVWGRRL
jgi:2-polyprenyl-3-methyl-5-hydroxy-6-metoxy-1,4-benzoquinol methylase